MFYPHTGEAYFKLIGVDVKDEYEEHYPQGKPKAFLKVIGFIMSMRWFTDF